LAFADEHAVQVLAADTEVRSGESRSGEADEAAFGLVRSGGHFTCCVVSGGVVDFLLRRRVWRGLRKRNRRNRSQMQQQSEKFSERTDNLSKRLGISLRALAPMMGLSVASLFGYRNGSIRISTKAWCKLEQAEEALEAKGNPPPIPSYQFCSDAIFAQSSANLKEPMEMAGNFPAMLREEISEYRADEKIHVLLERIATALEKLANRECGDDDD